MKQEKENLQNYDSAGEYLAPMVEVYDINTIETLCASPNGGTEGTEDGGNIDELFG